MKLCFKACFNTRTILQYNLSCANSLTVRWQQKSIGSFSLPQWRRLSKWTKWVIVGVEKKNYRRRHFGPSDRKIHFTQDGTKFKIWTTVKSVFDTSDFRSDSTFQICLKCETIDFSVNLYVIRWYAISSVLNKYYVILSLLCFS